MKKKIFTIVLVIFIVVFAVSLTLLCRYYLNASKTESETQELAQIVEADELDSSQDKEAENLGVNKKYYKLFKMNSDFAGWIRIDGTKIDYPVMQRKNEPEYYIHRNFKGQEDANGLPFLDKKSDIKDKSSSLLIYGHHMKSGIMFAGLLDYKDKDFYEKHKVIQFDTLYNTGRFNVVSAFYTEVEKSSLLGDDDASAQYNFYDYSGVLSEEEFAEYVNAIKKKSQYDTKIIPQYGQRLLTLVTCSYHAEDGRFVVVAVEK